MATLSGVDSVQDGGGLKRWGAVLLGVEGTVGPTTCRSTRTAVSIAAGWVLALNSVADGVTDMEFCPPAHFFKLRLVELV